MEQTVKHKPQRPGEHMRLIDALSYRHPVAAIASILHRTSGALMFLLLPFFIWMLDTSLSSEISYSQFQAVFVGGAGFVPGWFFKLLALALIWAYLYHLMAGLRHLWMDAVHSAVNMSFGRQSARAAIGVSVLVTLALAYKFFF